MNKSSNSIKIKNHEFRQPCFIGLSLKFDFLSSKNLYVIHILFQNRKKPDNMTNGHAHHT